MLPEEYAVADGLRIFSVRSGRIGFDELMQAAVLLSGLDDSEAEIGPL